MILFEYNKDFMKIKFNSDDDLPLLYLFLKIMVNRKIFVWVIKDTKQHKAKNIKSHSDYLCNGTIKNMIGIKNFDIWLLKRFNLSFKGIFNVNIYNIEYITMKGLDHKNNNNEEFLYLVFNNVNWYIKENNEIKYLAFASTEENKETLKKSIKLWEKIKSQIEAMNNYDLIRYKKDFMKIRFDSDDGFPLGKTLNILEVIIFTESVCEKYRKYYPQVFLDKYCLSNKKVAIR